MHPSDILNRDFYLQPVQTVARQLLGQRLVRCLNGERIAGIICETEAYDGEQDQACHARSGLTERNRVMYAAGGHAYVYFTYGMHWMLNCVCHVQGYPAAVLIRAILPTENLLFIQRQRVGILQPHWCDGPAKLTKAFNIDGKLNGTDLCQVESSLIIEKGIDLPDCQVQAGTRIGIAYAGEPWVSKPWRFFVSEAAMRAWLEI